MNTLIRGRRLAESLMTVGLDFYAPGSTDSGGLISDAFVFKGCSAGKFSVGSVGNDPHTRTHEVAGVSYPVMEGGLHIPACAFVTHQGLELRVGWECVVRSVGPDDDPGLVGRRFRVVNVPVKSHLTARRLDIVEVSSV